MKMRPVVFIQNFGLSGPGGGARILRSAFMQAPVSVRSICTGFPHQISPLEGGEEYVPRRPFFGALERTRFAGLFALTEVLFARRLERGLRHRLQLLEARAVHLVPHSWGDFVPAWRAAASLGLPVALSVHDDFEYTARINPFRSQLLPHLETLWRRAGCRLVVCPEIGHEYGRRYGQRPFVVHRDGATSIASSPVRPHPRRLHVYFMGLFHQGYTPNARALLRALSELEARHPELDVRATFRCDSAPLGNSEGPRRLEILPFAGQEVVEREVRQADLLYLPLPFGSEHSQFVRLSFSTKVITYLGAGVPILYHGPPEAAVAHYLKEQRAALVVESPDAGALRRSLAAALADPASREQIAGRAIVCAREDFDARALSARFWDAVLTAFASSGHRDSAE
jgi:glycosyltransferase involved in cell wall biosynthesis